MQQEALTQLQPLSYVTESQLISLMGQYQKISRRRTENYHFLHSGREFISSEQPYYLQTQQTLGEKARADCVSLKVHIVWRKWIEGGMLSRELPTPSASRLVFKASPTAKFWRNSILTHLCVQMRSQNKHWVLFPFHIWPPWATLKIVEITHLPSIVSGWAVKIWGFTAKRVPSTTSVTFSGATVCELLLDDKVQHPWRSWALKYSDCLLFPSWKWQLCVSSGADNMLLICGFPGQAECRHSESKPEGDK